MASWAKSGRGVQSPLRSPKSPDPQGEASEVKDTKKDQSSVDRYKSANVPEDQSPRGSERRAREVEGGRGVVGEISSDAERHTGTRRPSHSAPRGAAARVSKRSGTTSTNEATQRQQHQRQPHKQPDTMNPKYQLSDYRQKLTREMSARVGQTSPGGAPFVNTKRPSPIEEERASTSGSPSIVPSALPTADSSRTTASTDSTRTVRADDTAKSSSARTPSYPFPRMVTPGQAPTSSPTAARSSHLRRLEALTAELPGTSAVSGVEANAGARRPRAAPQQDEPSLSFRSERVLSSPSTPASAMTFLPSTAITDEIEGYAEHGVAGGELNHSHQYFDNADFPSPNLYDLALELSSEPSLDAWWNTVVQVATRWYRAERVTLAIPSDATDVENMPWGQKATYNTHEKDDELSLGYIGRGSSLGANATDAASDATPLLAASGTLAPGLASPAVHAEPVQRPSLTSRYSYTTYEDQKEQNPSTSAQIPQQPPAASVRPPLSRSQTSQPVPTQRSNIPKADSPPGMLPPKPYVSLNHAALEKHDAVEDPRKIATMATESPHTQRDTRGRLLPVLQALDYEADPLIDHNGVQRVLDRGRVVALTRSYPYVEPKNVGRHNQKHQPQPENEDGTSLTNTKAKATLGKQHLQPDLSAKMVSLLSSPGSAAAKIGARPSAAYMRRLTGTSIASKIEQAEMPRSRSPLYEECEQMPPSPWSQSPAPSPAIRHDPNDNPFFSEAVVDEDSFNPSLSPEEYVETRPPIAIGIDNAWTVLHIPLYHPLLSKTSQTFKLDSSKMERRSSPKRKSDGSPESSPEPIPAKPKQMPIAILSILSPIIPYPSNLRYSLEYLAPHMATSFSLCLHYSNLEAEVGGLNRHRHELGGFGGVDTEGHPLPTASAYVNTPYLPSDDAIAHTSFAGSLTSYSDYSARSRSIAGSPGGTPGSDSVALNTFLERRTNTGAGLSPNLASMSGDGYFGSRPANTGVLGRPATTPGGTSSSGAGGGSGQKVRKNSITKSDKRLSALRSPDIKPYAQEERAGNPVPEQAGTATAALAPLSPSTSRTEDSPVAAQQTQKGAGALLGEIASGNSVESAFVSARNRPGSLAPFNLGDGPSVPQLSAEHKKRGPDRESLGQEDLKLTISDKHPLLSPFISTPGGNQRHVNPHRSHHQHGHSHSHSQLHSYGADFASTFPSLPPSGTIAVKGASASMVLPPSAPSRTGSIASSSPVDLPPPSDRLKSLILDSLPAHVFVAMPHTGAIVWVNSRYLAYRGQTVEGLAEDPWGSLHPDDRDEYLKAWSHSVRTGDQFSRTVRIRRFDGAYRWFQARAVASRDRRNSILQFLGSYMDIHDQHIAELKAARQEEIEASEAKHRILANLIPQIIFTANEEEGITFANEQWLSYTGQSFQDLLGLGFMDFVHPDDLANCSFLPVPAHLQERRKRLLRSLSSSIPAKDVDETGTRPRTTASRPADGGEERSELAELARRGIIMVTTDDNGRPSYTTEVRLRSKTGEYRWHLVRCVETGTVDFGKGYNSYFGSATDINDHKLLETKLKEAMDSKTRFLSNMSHEIRTPLIGISGMVSFLQDTTLNEEQRDYTNTIQTSANSLLMIINDILDLSKVDAGMMKLTFEWFHTRSLIEDVNELVSTMAIAKGLELNYIVDEDVPTWVKGDRVRIRQVLLNVIGNAIKFTAKGEVFSRCRVVEQSGPSDDKITLEFSVTDTGRGFTKEEADLIFKPFSQIDGSSTRQHGGSGLGLVISRQLVELHGGRMNGTAVPGKGSTFTFTALFSLPTESDHPDGLATPSPEANIASGVTLTAMGLSTPSFMDPAAVIAAAAASAAGVGPSGLSKQVNLSPNPTSSPAAASSSSSDPSIRSSLSQSLSDRSSSISSVNTGGLARFSEAARASGQDLSQMKFKMPPSGDRLQAPSPASSPNSSDTTTTMTTAAAATVETKPTKSPVASTNAGAAESMEGKPSAFSILIICPQTHSREATTKHIETTLPKDRPNRIRAVATVTEAQKLLSTTDPEVFTHVVVNLPSPQEILELVDQLDRSRMLESANVLVLSDSVQRQAVNRLAAGTRYEELLSEARVTYIYKPVKPSRFAVIFDPAKERDISIDRNRSNAQRLVETQKQSYLDLEQRMGNKGYKVLLVEDNMVNQKVLKKYLHKVGVEVDLAADGVECTDIVLSRPHNYYSLILCDLHMPRKDGYQACREIREWESAGGYTKPIPIIALSANVMSDVHDKCVEAGFSKYITKPVDFIVLSRALAEFF